MQSRKELTLLDSPKNRQRVRQWFYAALLLLLIIDGFVAKHGHFPWEEAYAFYAVYGFIGCVGLIFLAKVLRWMVKRDEGYYD